MSVDLIQLGQDLGEAQATAEAAQEAAQIAEVSAVLALAAEASGGEEEGGHCPECEARFQALEAMFTALSDKYDEDMDVLARVLDELLGEVEAQEEEATEEEPDVELVTPEGGEDAASSDTASDKSGGEGDGSAGAGNSRQEPEAEKEPKHEKRKRPASSGGIRFRRGSRSR